MVSPVDKRALGPGEFTTAQNVRGNRRVITVRGPILPKSATGLPGGASDTLAGSEVVTLDGTIYQAVAIRHAPTSITPSATDTGTDVLTFAAVHKRTTGDVMVPNATVGGVVSGSTYYARALTTTTLTLHPTLADANSNTNIVNLTATVTAAFASPTETRVYLDILVSGGALTATGTAFTEITYTIGVDNNTRFADAGNVCFSVVREVNDTDLSPFSLSSGHDILVFSNGKEVRTFDATYFLSTAGQAGFSTFRHRKVDHPGMGTVKQTAFFPDWLNLSASNTVSITPSAHITANISTANPTTAGLGYAITFGATTVATDSVVIRLTDGDTVCSGRDLVLVYDTALFPEIWRALKMEVSNDGSTYYTVHNPTVDDDPETADVDLLASTTVTFTQAAFRLDSAVVSPSLVVKYIRFTWVPGYSPAGNSVLYLMNVMGGGFMTGGWALGQTLYDSLGRPESIGVVAINAEAGRSTGLMGVQDQRNAAAIAVVTTQCYAYELEFEAPTQAAINQGVTHAVFYGSPTIDASMRLIGALSIATRSTLTWTATYPPGTRVTTTINTPTIKGVRPMPDGLNECAPPCLAMCAATGRLFCGAFKSVNASATAQGADIMVSEQDYPFRFRGLVATNDDGSISETSGSRLMFHGEIVQQIIAMSGDSLGGESVVAFTDKSTWVMSGRNATTLNRPRRVCQHGTLSPWSVVTNRNEVYWLDQEKQMRRMNGDFSVDSIAKNRFDNIFGVIPDAALSRVCTGVRRDLIYVSYTLAGGTNNVTVAVYDSVEDHWVRDASLLDTGHTFGRIFPYKDELRYWSQDALLMEHDATSGTLDGGTTGIRPFIETGEYSPDFHGKFQFSVPWVYCAKDNDNAFILTITGRQYTSNEASGTVSLTSSDAMVKRAPPPEVGIEDNSAYLTLSTTTGITARKTIAAFGFHFIEIPGETLERTD